MSLATRALMDFQDIPFQDPKFLLVDIVSKSERCAGDRDGYHVDMKITNKFPCVGVYLTSLIMYLTTKQDIKIDEIMTELVDRYGDRVSFKAEAMMLTPGESTITLFCPVSFHYQLQTIHFT